MKTKATKPHLHIAVEYINDEGVQSNASFAFDSATELCEPVPASNPHEWASILLKRLDIPHTGIRSVEIGL